MNPFLQQTVLSNSIGDYLRVLAVIAIAFLLKRFISLFLANWLYRILSKKAGNDARQSFLNLVLQPLQVFIILLVSFVALDKLNFPQVLQMKIYHSTTKEIIESAFIGMLIVAFIWLCRRGIDFIALIFEEKANQTSDLSDNQLIIFFKDFFKVILVLVGILLVLRFSFNKEIGTLLTGLSIVGAAIALAARESMENLIASFIIFFDKPFVTGELVKVGLFTGTVEKIGLRSTRIRTLEKSLITVPNKQMVDTIVDNISMRTQGKGEVRIEIDLSTSVNQLRDFTQALPGKIMASGAESCTVFLAETGINAHIVQVEYFTPPNEIIEKVNARREKINWLILDELAQHQITLAAANNRLTVQMQSPQ
jgi:MscS family membrane protein